MSSFAAILQRRAVHMITDGLTYCDGAVLQVDKCKSIPLQGMNAALTATGPALLCRYLADILPDEFRTFDDLIDAGQNRLAELFREYVDDFRGGDAVAMLCLIGWHESGDKPGLYTMRLDTGGRQSTFIAEHGDGQEDPPYVLSPIDCAATPGPSFDDYKASRFDVLMDFDKVDPETTLLHQIEIQRRIPLDGKFYVGGHAQMTSVTPAGVAQRIVHVWPEDRPGETVSPKAIDWTVWPSGRSGIAAQLSRLQRERMEKKARKSKLRS